MSGNQLLLAVLLVPLAGSVLVMLARLGGRKAPGYAALGLTLATLAIGVSLLARVAHRGQVAVNVPWLRIFGAAFSLRADAISIVLVLVIATITSLAVAYSFGYYQGKPRSATFYALVTIFLGGMIGTAIAAETILFYLFWEMMLIPSYALVAFWGKGKFATQSGLKYFIYTHLGAVAMLGAILWIYSATGVTDIPAIKRAISVLPEDTLTILAGLFIFAFAVKMAIFPFHSWLPGAYDDGPLPVTAIISGAMMSAGIYGMIRFPFTLFPPAIVLKFQLPLMVLAVLTQFYGGVMALTSKRMRRLLAYSSISQMGYVLFGIFSANAAGLTGSFFHLVNHALIKSLLFMAIGSVITRTERQKISELGGLAANLPVTTWGCVVGALAIAGAPPLSGFQSEWLIFAGGFATPYRVLGILALAAGVLTAAYALRLVRRIFFGALDPSLAGTHESPGWMLLPIVAFSAMIVLIGILPGPVVGWIGNALRGLLT